MRRSTISALRCFGILTAGHHNKGVTMIRAGQRLAACVLMLSAATAIPYAPPAQAQQEEETQAQSESSGIEEIVVRARRREERLVDTPVSVTALDASALRNSTITEMRELSTFVPNLRFQTGQNPNQAQVFIRGVGQGDPGQVSSEPGVGIYVDEVYLARAQASVLDLVDVGQLEVLRGPQGTLFGKNTVGGALLVTSVKPDDELEGSILLRPGNYNKIDTRASLNVPIDWGYLEDRLYSRFTFASFYDEGYMENVLRDEHWSDRNTVAFQGALRFLPLDELTIDVTGNYSKSHARPRGGQCRFFNPDASGLALAPAEFVEECMRSGSFGSKKFEADTPSISKLESSGVWGTIQWDLGDVSFFDSLALKSITAYREQNEGTGQDMDFTSVFLGADFRDGRDLVLDDGLVLPSEPLDASQVSQEVQLNGTAWDDRVNFVSGVYYLADEATRGQAVSFLPDFPTVGGTFWNRSEIDNWSIALFGQASVDVFEWMSLTAGLRWTREEKEASLFDFEPATDRIRADAEESKSFSAWTPMASIALRLPEDHMPDQLDSLMGYFTYSQGYKSGGFNLRPLPMEPGQLEPYDEEELDSFEIGFKTIAFDQRLTFNTSLFISDYEDIQVLTIQSVDVGGEVPVAFPLTENAASADVMGAEFELALMPIEGLRIDANAALLDSEYGEYDGVSDFTGDPINRKGEGFNNVPDYSAFAAAQYTWEFYSSQLDWLSGALTPRIEWQLTGAIHYQGPELVTGRQDAYNLLNARLGYVFNDDRTEIALWGRNLTDENYFNGSLPITAFGYNVQLRGRPLTFGAEISHRFF